MFRADYFPQLLEKVISYMHANKMKPPENPAAWLQDVMCRQCGWGSETCRLVDN